MSLEDGKLAPGPTRIKGFAVKDSRAIVDEAKSIFFIVMSMLESSPIPSPCRDRIHNGFGRSSRCSAYQGEGTVSMRILRGTRRDKERCMNAAKLKSGGGSHSQVQGHETCIVLLEALYFPRLSFSNRCCSLYKQLVPLRYHIHFSSST